MNCKVQYKLGQKVINIGTKYSDDTYDIGYVIGVKICRSYQSAGIFQNGGLNIDQITRQGFGKTYVEACDEVKYSVLLEYHAIGRVEDKDLKACDLIPATRENLKKYKITERK